MIYLSDGYKLSRVGSAVSAFAGIFIQPVTAGYFGAETPAEVVVPHFGRPAGNEGQAFGLA
jgi:hypothetical protein